MGIVFCPIPYSEVVGMARETFKENTTKNTQNCQKTNVVPHRENGGRIVVTFGFYLNIGVTK